MFVIAQHRILDPDRLFSMSARDVEEGGLPAVRGHRFYPSRDHKVAVCLWETDSLQALRDYLDPLMDGVLENTYFEVDDEHALGLPRAPAGAATS